jgi:hypothetical protein
MEANKFALRALPHLVLIATGLRGHCYIVDINFELDEARVHGLGIVSEVVGVLKARGVPVSDCDREG